MNKFLKLPYTLTFKNYEKKLGIVNLQDWYKQYAKHVNRIISEEEEFIPISKGINLITFLKVIYPKFLWLPWKFERVPREFWNSIKNQRFYLSEIQQELKIEKIQDWYKIQTKDLQKHKEINCSTFLTKRKYSLQKTLVEIYPEYKELLFAWNFDKIPNHYFDSKQNQQFFFTQLAKEIKINKMEDWYKVKAVTFKNYSLLGKHNSIFKLLQTVFPNYIWCQWRFKTVSEGCWDNLYSRRQLFDDLAMSLNINLQNQWYTLQNSDIINSGGVSVIHKYKPNLIFCVSDLYPEVNWLPWKFSKVPKDFWLSEDNVKQFLKWYEKEYKFTSNQEWEEQLYDNISKSGAASLLKAYGNVSNILNHFYPSKTDLDKFKFKFSSGKRQLHLQKLIKELFPTEEIKSNFKHPDFVFQNSKKQIELDIFLPNLNMAFEYQGEQHYDNTVFGDTNQIKERDEQKRKLCRNNSVFLIEVPYWWDGTLASLTEIINAKRPDILSHMQQV